MFDKLDKLETKLQVSKIRFNSELEKNVDDGRGRREEGRGGGRGRREDGRVGHHGELREDEAEDEEVPHAPAQGQAGGRGIESEQAHMRELSWIAAARLLQGHQRLFHFCFRNSLALAIHRCARGEECDG